MTVLMTVGSFLASLFVLLPLPGHWRARNVPTISIIIWLCVVNLINAANTIAWMDNTTIKLVVWCDIGALRVSSLRDEVLRKVLDLVTRVGVAANVALPAACCRLCVHLERVASIRSVSASQADKTRRMLRDIAFCWLVPLIYVALCMCLLGSFCLTLWLMLVIRLHCPRSSLRYRRGLRLQSGRLCFCPPILPRLAPSHSICPGHFRVRR